MEWRNGSNAGNAVATSTVRNSVAVVSAVDVRPHYEVVGSGEGFPVLIGDFSPTTIPE